MKKTNKLIVILAAMTLLTGCIDNTSMKGRITKAMKEYAKKNFDDPKSLQEIASIEPGTPFDMQKNIRALLEETSKLDSLYENKNDSIFSAMGKLEISQKKMWNADETDKLMFAIKIGDYLDNYLNSLSDKKHRDYYFKEVDSLLKNDTLYPITTCTINVRVKEEGALKIKHFYTWYCDTTTVFTIFDKPVPMESFEKEERIFETCEKFTNYSEKRRNFIDEGEKIYLQMQKYTK